MKDNLKNKVVLITGSNMGIGREIAFKFAKQGSIVIITFNEDPKSAADTEKKCKSLGAPSTMLIRLNLLDDSSIKDCIKSVVAKHKNIDILINNAGVISWKKFLEQNFLEIETQIRVNLEGLIKITRESLPFIREMVINIASSAGKNAHQDLTGYCASKFGVRGFTQAIAQENPNLKFYNINPGTTSTRMTDFTGIDPSKVAQIILETAQGKYKVDDSLDVDVWKILKSDE